jgi:hypothetical protein
MWDERLPCEYSGRRRSGTIVGAKQSLPTHFEVVKAESCCAHLDWSCDQQQHNAAHGHHTEARSLDL